MRVETAAGEIFVGNELRQAIGRSSEHRGGDLARLCHEAAQPHAREDERVVALADAHRATGVA